MPAEEHFSKPPSGKEINGDGIKALMAGEATPPAIEDIAGALGGDVKAEQPVVAAVEPPVVEDVEVPVSDRREYLRTLLAGEPWIKSYELFGGAVVVAFNTRTVAENDKVRQTVTRSAVTRERAKMKASTTSVEKDGKSADVDFDAMGEIMFASIRKAFRHFEDTCDVLFAKANDSNFWKETAGVI